MEEEGGGGRGGAEASLPHAQYLKIRSPIEIASRTPRAYQGPIDGAILLPTTWYMTFCWPGVIVEFIGERARYCELQTDLQKLSEQS